MKLIGGSKTLPRPPPRPVMLACSRNQQALSLENLARKVQKIQKI